MEKDNVGLGPVNLHRSYAIIATAGIVIALIIVFAIATASTHVPEQQTNGASQVTTATKAKSLNTVGEVSAQCDIAEDEEGKLSIFHTPGDEDDETFSCVLDAIKTPQQYRSAITNAKTYPSAQTEKEFQTLTWGNFIVSWNSKAVDGAYVLFVADHNSTIYNGEEQPNDPDVKHLEEALFPQGENKDVPVSDRMDKIEELKNEGWSISFYNGNDVSTIVDSDPSLWLLQSWISIRREDHTITLLVKQNQTEPTPAPQEAPQQTPQTQQTESSPQSTTPKSQPSAHPQSTYYQNCKAVWNALGHGITKNDPGYSTDLDADGDGRACERRPNY